MSKNFELLHKISNENEKDLLQTLDGWEDTDGASVNREPEAEFDENARAKTRPQTSLPDVFRAVEDTLGPLDLVIPDLSRDPESVDEPIQESTEQKVQGENQSSTLEHRFPISRNPITPLNSVLNIPQAWVKPEIKNGPGDEIELELEPETLPSAQIPESQPRGQRPVSSSDEKVQEPSPVIEENTRHDPLRAWPLRSLGGESLSIGVNRARKSRTRTAYKDPRREAIAREEQLKLVQRVFLTEANSPRMVQFSGLEGDSGCASICIRAGEILAAQTDGSVCLIDMGFRASSLHEYCGVKNDKGLAEAIEESNPIQEVAHQLSPGNLWVIPSGHGAPKLDFPKVADRLRARMEELRKAFRYVVVHSGSLWLNADAMMISKWTDGVVLILEAHSTRRDTARRIKESLAAANARVLGVVLNNRTYPIPETLYSRL